MLVGQQARGAGQGPLDLRRQRGPGLAKGVARAGFDQRLQRFAAQRAPVHPLAQLGQGLEFPALVARLQNDLHRALAHALDGGHAEADGLALAGRGEINPALVHVRPQHLNAHLARLGDVFAQLVRGRHVVRHHGAVEFHREIRLQIRRLIGHDGVGGGVGLVEAVAGEFLQQVENLVRLGLRDVVPLVAALDERLALLLHLLHLLLAHRPAQQIRRPQRVAGQQLRGLHHLLLVNQDAVGLLGNGFEQRMFVADFHLAVAALDEIWDQVHRAGPVQRHEGGDVLDGADLEFFAQVPHPAGFQLEHAERFRAVQQVVGFLVVERQLINVDGDPLRALDHLAGVADDGQGFEAEEIHLQQAELPDGVHGILGHERAAFVQLERQQVHERLRPDDHAGRMDAGVPRQVLQDEGSVDELPRHLLGFVGLLELRRLLERLRQIHLELGGDHLRQPVAVPVRQPHHPAHVPHHGFGAHGSERDDLGHSFAPVFFADILDDVRPAVVGEIDVDIRRIDALRIQEALEQQAVADGVHVRDVEQVGDQRAGGAAARHAGDAVFAAVSDEVRHDEEIGDEPGFLDDLQLQL